MVKKIFLYFAIFFFVLSLGAFSVGAILYHFNNVDASKLEHGARSLDYYDANGDLIESVTTQAVVLTELPEYTKWAFICVEDKNFYNHHGVSPERIAKATYKNAVAGKTKEGASTITQQLIKNTHLSSEKTFQRKIREATLALKLEKQYTKDQILEMYLDIVYFGNGINGLDNASHFYFDKSANELTIRESASLAGLLKSPAKYDPINNPVNFADRTNLVLRMMYEQGKITKDEYENARVEDLKIHAMRDHSMTSMYLSCATNQASQITHLTAGEMLQRGYKIHTFFDKSVQTAIEETMDEDDYIIKNLAGNRADSLIIASSENGEIRGIYATNRLLVNARRNFGSVLKPLCVYAPAIETGAVTPDTIIVDEPYVAGDFHPQNHDGKFHGEISVRTAVAQSYNVPAVKVLEYTTIERAVDIAKRLGLPLGAENLNLALGVTSNGLTAIETLGGYCALANGGNKTTPSFVKRITDANGRLVFDYQKPYIDALTRETTLTVTDMLRDTVKDGTAKKLSSLEFDIGAKTGTTERVASGTNTDAVNISYTPNNVLFVWNGNADMKSENDLPRGTTGGGVTSYIARDIMQKINTEPATFAKPTEPVTADLTATQKLTATPQIVLSGRVGETGAPTIKFETLANKKYEIHRRISGEYSILQVVKPTTDGEYIFNDTTAPTGKVIEYFIKSGDTKSNEIKLYSASPINKSATANTNGKHWFF